MKKNKPMPKISTAIMVNQPATICQAGSVNK